MAHTDLDINYLAHLARLALTPEEAAALNGQLAGVLSYVEKLKEVDVTGVEPMAHAQPRVNVSRPDEVRPSLPHSEALRNAPASANGLFVVPKIVE
ncbi:MAG: Asp-tRNA(Asn)/Glu-tRNA(Gln) amidotransferase subunit GatC [Verrucomicrobiales bacterium]|nr:Asp-tRNA(Asn)/Glu-tRNA(Gln) amidotransferase subunit GatC [Verrucomicrobiales bacterium]MCP5525435.1 Asp-tRNA(Asn)/Glu-tRNA(Gln) amidotransferase subunit GatC [Verrucomicrobiales bacterium]